MDSGITPVMNVGGGCGYGNGYGAGAFGGEWIFGLIVLAALFNGGFGGMNGRGFVSDEMSNSLQTNILEASANQRENCSQFTATNANITNGFANLSRDLCSQSFGLTNQISGVASDIKDRLFSMSAQQAQCLTDFKLAA